VKQHSLSQFIPKKAKKGDLRKSNNKMHKNKAQQKGGAHRNSLKARWLFFTTKTLTATGGMITPIITVI
jgi:hypothetical protein